MIEFKTCGRFMIPERIQHGKRVERPKIDADKKLLLWSQTAWNSISVRMAILDDDGFILETNRAWKDFARANGITRRPDTVGINYLTVCDLAEHLGAVHAKKAAAGIRSVLSGNANEFVMEYPCHPPGGKCWCNLRVRRLLLAYGGPIGLIVSHEDITNVKQAHAKLRRRETYLRLQTLKLEEANAALRRRESDLHLQAHRLEEANAALRALLRQRDVDRQEIEEKILCQVKELVLPYLERLKAGHLSLNKKNLVEIAKSNLKAITSPFARTLSSHMLRFTPSEIRVAGLTRDGLTSKEIADILCITPRTVAFHRENIRSKLGLQNRKANLRTHLLSLSEYQE